MTCRTQALLQPFINTGRLQADFTLFGALVNNHRHRLVD